MRIRCDADKGLSKVIWCHQVDGDREGTSHFVAGDPSALLTSEAEYTSHIETYYDTPDFHLLKKNIWLRTKGGSWSLKKVTPDTPDKTETMNLLWYHSYDRLGDIDTIIQSRWEELVPYASFQVYRLAWPEKRIDICGFGNKYYTIGTLTNQPSQSEWDGSIAGNSKIIEFLRMFDPNVLQQCSHPAHYTNEECAGHSCSFPIPLNQLPPFRAHPSILTLPSAMLWQQAQKIFPKLMTASFLKILEKRKTPKSRIQEILAHKIISLSQTMPKDLEIGRASCRERV